MSGNQEPRINQPTWRCSDFDAAIPIKKRKYFVQQQIPAMEEPGPAFVAKNKIHNVRESHTSVGRRAFDSYVADENQNMVGGSKTNVGVPFRSVSVGNADNKAESFGNHVFDQTRVKVEGTNSLIYSGLLAGFENPSSSNTLGSSVHCSMDKLPMSSYQPGVAVTSGLTSMKVDQTVFAHQNTDSVSTCTKSGDYISVNRSHWDLNTTTDAWEDALDRTAPFKSDGAFLNSNRSLHLDIETSSCPDTTVIAKPVSEKQKESVGFKSPMVTLTRFDNQVNPTCSLSLGLSSHPPVEKSPFLPAATLKARPDCIRPIIGNVKSVNLKTVKSEVVEESVKQEVVGRFSQETSPSSDSLNPVGPEAIKVEPFSFTQSEHFSRKDGTLNHPHTPIAQTDKILDLPTSPTPNQKEKYIPYPSGSSNAPLPMNVRTRETCVQSYHDYTLKENSGQSLGGAKEKLCDGLKHGVVHMNNNLDASGLNVSLTGQRNIAFPFHSDFQNSNNVKEKESQPPLLGSTGNKHIKECSASSSSNEFKNIDESCLKLVEMASTEGLIKRLTPELQSGMLDGSGEKEGRIVQDGETIDNSNDTPAEFSESRQRRIINLPQDSDSFVSLRKGTDRMSNFSHEPRKYVSRWSDESCKFSRERYHGRVMRSPRLNIFPDKRRLSDSKESNLHDRDRKSFEFDNHGSTHRGGAFVSKFHRGRRPADDEETSFSHSFTRRTSSFTQRESTNNEDAPVFHGFRDGEKFTRGSQSSDTEPMFTSRPRPYRGGRGFARGRRSFSDNFRRGSPGFCSRSPIRSRKRSASPSSSFSNSSQEDLSDHTRERSASPSSGYRRGRLSSPEQSGYPREMVARRHNSPPYSHRLSNAGRGRGYERGRGYGRGRGYERGRGYGRGRGYERGRGYGRSRGGYERGRGGYERGRGYGRGRGYYARGRGYGRDGISFWKPSYRNFNNLDSRERINSDAEFFEGPTHSDERFGVDTELVDEEQRSLVERDGENKNSAENASGRTENMEEEET
ncbi:unnamed protein product [Cochlearia groenlandica]